MSNFDNLHSLNFDEFYVKSMIIFKTPMYGCKLMTMEEWVINTSIMNAVDVLITAWSYLRGFRPRVGNTCTLYADIKNCSLTVWIRFNRCLCFPKFIINSSLNEITFILFFVSADLHVDTYRLGKGTITEFSSKSHLWTYLSSTSE